METHHNKTDLIERIRDFEIFQNVEISAIHWLVEHGTLQLFNDGEEMFRPFEEVKDMRLLVSGQCVLFMAQNNELKEVGVYEPGEIAGLLPFSRMKQSRALGKAIGLCELLVFQRDIFPELVCQSYQLTQNLVGLMSDRIREFSYRQSQNEKLLSLGKLSAGLAHELNNPAAAMVRSAEMLHQNIHATPERFKGVMKMQVSDEQTDAINQILFSKIDNQDSGQQLSLLQKESLKDDLIDWLEDNDVKRSDEMAETFLEFGVSVKDLDQIAAIMNDNYLEPILNWIESTLSKEVLICEIKEAAGRIAELVQSIKAYTHMDRSDSKAPFDIKAGIINTLTMLKHKLKQKSIQLVKDFAPELPLFNGHAGQLNQVWTNIIDNAIDAMDNEGILEIKAYKERENLCVTITDNGKGIPEEVQSRIFDPFFTTKPIGQGTGLGLDIANRLVTNHKGTIDVTSVPGKTTFKICLPIQA